MTRTLIATLVLALSTCAVSLAAFGADKQAPKVIKTDDLPANLKGGKEKTARKYNDGIPQCFSRTRAAVAGDSETMAEWSSSHENHPCAGAATLYVCRAGKNLSVRCE